MNRELHRCWPGRIGPGGFTLVELLVVIAIIVILLALLVGGLDRVLKSAERAKCAANQRTIAHTCAAYALEYERQFPSAKNNAGALAFFSARVRNVLSTGNNSGPLAGDYAAAAVGLGRLVAGGRLPSTRLAEAIQCPTLDTTSAVPVKLGMDEPQYNRPNNQGNDCAGGSFWVDLSRNKFNIYSSYTYRAKSYAATHSGGEIRTNIARASFVITCDFITASPAANALNYGRRFHHLDGWNISYGDGHASYVRDRNGPGDPAKQGYVEKVVIGGQDRGFKGPPGFPNNKDFAAIDGNAQVGADEAVYAFLGSG